MPDTANHSLRTILFSQQLYEAGTIFLLQKETALERLLRFTDSEAIFFFLHFIFSDIL